MGGQNSTSRTDPESIAVALIIRQKPSAFVIVASHGATDGQG